MKSVNNKTALEIIKWLEELKSKLLPNEIESREKIRKINKAIKILSHTGHEPTL